MKRAVVYILLATGFFLFTIFSPYNQDGYKKDTPSPVLNRRLGYKFSTRNLDPLVKMVHRKSQKKDYEKGYYNTNNNIASSERGINDYFGNDGRRLNVTSRLILLFPMWDHKPKDGKVSFEELEEWNREQAMDRLLYRTWREMEIKDKDGDGAISFGEFMPHFSDQDLEKNGMGYGEAGWWMEQFRNADVDRNGNLNIDEFNNLLHPEDSNNEDIQKWLLRDKIKRMDDDVDGKLNQAEFSKYAYKIYKSYAEFEVKTGAQIPTQESKFDELDLNNDKFLDVKELLPMLGYLKPGELSYAKLYTSFLIRKADDNGDGLLTIDEMLNHQFTFSETVNVDDIYYEDDDNYYVYHDEL